MSKRGFYSSLTVICCGVIASCFAYLPIFLKLRLQEYHGHHYIQLSLHSDDFQFMIILCLGVSLPLIFDFLVDVCYLKFQFLLSRIALISGFVIPNLIFYCYSSHDPELYLASCVAKVMLIIGGLSSYLLEMSVYYSKYHIMVLIFYFSALFNSFFISWSHFIGDQDMIFIGRIIYIMVLLEALFISSIAVYELRGKWKNLLSNREAIRIVIYSACVVIYLFSYAIIAITFGLRAFSVTSEHELISYMVCDIVVVIASTTISARLTREDATVIKVWGFIATQFS